MAEHYVKCTLQGTSGRLEYGACGLDTAVRRYMDQSALSLKAWKMKLFLFLGLISASPSLADKLQYLFTVLTPGTNVTFVGQLDGQQFVYYDSKMKKLIHRLECVNGFNEDVWKLQKDWIRGNEQDLTPFLSAVMKDFNHSEGLHTWQWIFGCELYNNTTTVYDQSCYDGEHAITLDPQNLTWTTSSDEARTLKKRWEATGHWAVDHKHTLENKCIEFLNHFMSWCNKTLDRKVPPEVSVFQNHSSPSPEVVCHATGFFPKPVMITWQKDGEDVHEDMVELRETLPNQDGSFQKRSILKVPAEELQKHNYTCVVQHSSLEKKIRKEVPKGEGSNGRTFDIIIAVVLALVAVVVGIVVWKKKMKKNSGERSEELNTLFLRRFPQLHGELQL